MSRSSAHSATAVIWPTPSEACSAKQPGWRRANAAIRLRGGRSPGVETRMAGRLAARTQANLGANRGAAASLV